MIQAELFQGNQIYTVFFFKNAEQFSIDVSFKTFYSTHFRLVYVACILAECPIDFYLATRFLSPCILYIMSACFLYCCPSMFKQHNAAFLNSLHQCRLTKCRLFTHNTTPNMHPRLGFSNWANYFPIDRKTTRCTPAKTQLNFTHVYIESYNWNINKQCRTRTDTNGTWRLIRLLTDCV